MTHRKAQGFKAVSAEQGQLSLV